jgi:hypothetical protein
MIGSLILTAGIGLLLLNSCVQVNQGKIKFSSADIQDRMAKDINFLASDELGGRPPGTKYEKIAAEYIQSRWKEAGLKSVSHPFLFDAGADSLIPSQNLVAFLDHKADSTIVIGAHFDHLGQGGEKSREIRKTGIHPGADDNASGVAMMLELSRSLSSSGSKHYNYLFVAFSAHEMGLHGSRNFVESSYLAGFKVKLVMNLDMVGRLDVRSNTVRLSFCQGFPELQSLSAYGNESELKVRPDVEHETVNDFSVFCEAGIPVISITTGIHEDYHRTSDVSSKINYPGMLKVLGFCNSILEGL